jgi:hypothetical protein
MPPSQSSGRRSQHRSLPKSLFFLVAIVMLWCPACNSCFKPVKDLTTVFAQASKTLEGIGTDLANQTADFNLTASRLTDVIKSLPEEAGVELRNALQQVAERATQAAGIEVRCTSDFARERIAGDVSYLAKLFAARAHLQPEPQRPPAEPMICQPSPSSVRRGATNAVVVWDGYDFGKAGTLSAALENQNRQRTPVDILSLGSPYKLTADLSRVQDQMSPTVSRLVLLWSDQVKSEVAIEMPPQSTRQVIEVPLAPWGPLVATHCQHPRNAAADSEFAGHGPKVDWSVALTISNHHLDREERERKIVAHITYEAMEWNRGAAAPQDDFTEACGDWSRVVYTAPVGYRILRIVDTPVDSGSYVDVSTSVADSQSGSIYNRYVLGGDGSGSDVGAFTQIAAPVQGKVKIEVEVPPS